ncbi:hypothetical protein PInf_009295 [Phytophthora infestans]|nr:hypothetical protein PInf_009295 [Phytophthora infestans]
METTAIYRDETCNGSAVNVLVVDNDNCTAVACSPKIFGDSTNYYETTICYSTDRLSYSPMEDLFLGQTFLEGQAYGDNNCTDEAYKYRQGLLVGECEPFTTKDNYMYSVSATLASDGSVAMSIYNNTACTDLPITTYALRRDTLASHLCYNDTGLPHVVSSIGAAWDSLVDLGSIMDQGALKTMLAKTPAWIKPNIVNVNFQLVAARKTHKTTGVPAFPSMQGGSKETETDFATYKAMTSEVTLMPAIEETGLVENSTKLTD